MSKSKAHRSRHRIRNIGKILATVLLLGNLVPKVNSQQIYEEKYFDALGNLTTYRGPVYGPTPNQAELTALTHQWQYQYVSGFSLLKQASHPQGSVENWNWDSSFRVTQHNQQTGSRVENWTYTAGGNVASHTISNSTESAGWTYNWISTSVVQVTDPRGAVSQESYDVAGRLIQKVGPAPDLATMNQLLATNAYETWSYDAAGNMVQYTDALGSTWSFLYDTQNRVTHAFNPLGMVEEVYYDSQGRAIQITRPGVSTALGSELFTYDANGNLETRGIRIDNTTVSYTGMRYDAAGNLLSIHGPATSVAGAQAMIMSNSSVLVEYVYDALGRRTQIKDAFGTVTQASTMDARNNSTMASYPNIGTTNSEFDFADRLSSYVDALGRKTVYSRDSFGRATQETGPWLDSNANGLPDDLDPANVTTRSYNLAGMPTSESTTGNGSIANTYAYTDLMSSTSAGVTVDYVRDAAGRVIEVKRAGISILVCERDLAGRITRKRQAPGTAYEIRHDFAYDAAGRITQLTSFPMSGNASVSESTSFQYDSNGNMSRIVDSAGIGTNYVYDLDGSLKQIIPDTGLPVTYAYDLLGRLSSKTIVGEPTWNYTYDANGRLVNATQSGKTWTWTYDSLGKRLTQSEPSGITYSFGYDSHGNMTSMTSSSASGTPRTYIYDSHGRITHEQEGSIFSNYSYDASGRLATYTTTLNEVFSYAYDADGRLSATTLPNGDIVHRIYGSNGLVASVVHERAGTQNTIETYGYDNLGRLTSRSLAGVVNETYAYDGKGRVRDFAATESIGTTSTVDHRIYTYTGSDKVASIQHQNGDLEQFTYLPTGELTTARRSGAIPYNRTYTYNSMGRVAQENNGGTITTFSYDSAGKLTQRQTGTSKIKYTYDAAGRVTLRTNGTNARSFGYDAWGRIASITTNGVSTQYVRDTQGQLVAKFENGSFDYYTIDESGRTQMSWHNGVLDELSIGFDVNQTDLVERPNGYFVYVNEPIGGSVNRIINVATGSVDSLEYEAFGDVIASSGAPWNTRQYQGLKREAAHDLYWNNARTYDPDDLAFTAPDPMRLDSLERSYVRTWSDPVNHTDPSGMCTIGKADLQIKTLQNWTPIATRTRNGISVTWGLTEIGNVTIDGETYKYVNPQLDPPCYPDETDHARTDKSGDAAGDINARVPTPRRDYAIPLNGTRATWHALATSAAVQQVTMHEHGHARLIEAYLEAFLNNALCTLGGIKSFMTHDETAAKADAKKKWTEQRDRIIAAVYQMYRNPNGSLARSAGHALHNNLIDASTMDTDYNNEELLLRVPAGAVNQFRPVPHTLPNPGPDTTFSSAGFQLLMANAEAEGDKEAKARGWTTSPCACKHTKANKGH